jgi:uncharacterized protein (DUF1800 family)
MPADIDALTAYNWPDLVEQVLDVSDVTPHHIGVPNLDESNGYYRNFVSMVWFWLDRCRTSHAPLVEKMVLFWHGHLCSSLGKVSDRQLMFDQNQLFRTHGLGNFEDLLQRVSVQPAMLSYLDNDRNVAGSPNENFAREVMELFTLGIGHYTEEDVTESARAWTGHILNDHDAYAFTPEAHDWNNKTFFGQTGNWDGPDVLSHIINGPKKNVVARFIAAKLWSFLAYPNPEPEVVDTISAAFASSGMEITPLIRAILLHPQFRSQQAKNGLIRSPIEFVVAGMRIAGFGCDIAHPEWTLRSMGQQPFYPPNVSGWKQNGYWINSSALWAKAKFASTIRWKLYEQDDLDGTSSMTPAQAADAALARFGIVAPSAATRNTLISYVENERANTSWGERAGLLFLPLLTPEFQLA